MVHTVTFEDLHNWLLEQPENTIDTPYELQITGITSDNISGLGDALGAKDTIKKYVDLTATTLPNVTTLENAFVNTLLVHSPVIPDSVTSLEGTFSGTPLISFECSLSNCNIFRETFSNCTELLTVSIHTDSTSLYMNNTLYGCTKLKKIVFDAQKVTSGSVSGANSCRYCPSLEELEWLIPISSLYYNFMESSNSLKKITLKTNVLNRNAEYIFGGSLINLEELTLITSPNNFSDTSNNPICNTSPSTSIFGSLQKLKKIKTYVNFDYDGSGQKPTSMVMLNTCPLLEEAECVFENADQTYYANSSIFNFTNCPLLTSITIKGLSKSQIFRSNSLYNCPALEEICIKNDKPVISDDWHFWKLTYDSDTVKGKIYNADGTNVTIPQTSIAKTDLQLPILTDELWFPEEADVDIDLLITKMLSNKYGVFKKTVLPPDQKNFVLWAQDSNNVVSNFLAKGAVDSVYPIGCTYTQYPHCPDPNYLFGAYSTWTELNFGGAFFRASGGKAEVYDRELTVKSVALIPSSVYYKITFYETCTFTNSSIIFFEGTQLEGWYVEDGGSAISMRLLEKPSSLVQGSKVFVSQNNTTAVNGLHTNSSADGTGTNGRTPSGGSHEHRITAGCEGGTGNEGSTNFITGSASGVSTKTMNSKNKANTTNSSHYHEIYLFGDEETRPENFTIKIWKRTA